MKHILVFILFVLFHNFLLSAQKQVVWNIDNLSNIAGNKVVVNGNPQIVETDLGLSVAFDGVGDRLLINGNPLQNATEFTIELIFKPNLSNPKQRPRLIHITAPIDSVSETAQAITLECRYTKNKKWYADTFIRNKTQSRLVLCDSTKLHDLETWVNLTISYKDGVMKQYVNGVEELSGNVIYGGLSPNAIVSVGARMNHASKLYFDGIIAKLIFTLKALEPIELYQVPSK